MSAFDQARAHARVPGTAIVIKNEPSAVDLARLRLDLPAPELDEFRQNLAAGWPAMLPEPAILTEPPADGS